MIECSVYAMSKEPRVSLGREFNVYNMTCDIWKCDHSVITLGSFLVRAVTNDISVTPLNKRKLRLHNYVQCLCNESKVT